MQVLGKRLATAILAGGVALGGWGDAGAQQKERKRKGGEPPAAAAPARPPAMKIDLQPSQPKWTKVCGKDPGSARQVCYTTRDFGQGPDQPPVMAVAIYDVKGEEKRLMRVLLPVALLLRPGFRFSVDDGEATGGTFAVCFPNGCFAEAALVPKVLDTLKTGTTLSVSVRNQTGGEVSFAMPLAGFGQAFDGAPIDESEIVRMQQEMRRRQEELRKNRGGGAAPAPAAPAK